MTGLSRPSIYRLMNRLVFPFPKPVQRGHRVYWSRRAVEKWVKEEATRKLTTEFERLNRRL